MNMQAKLLLPGFEKDLSDSEVVSMDSPYEYERLKPEHRGETCPKFDSQKSFNLKRDRKTQGSTTSEVVSKYDV